MAVRGVQASAASWPQYDADLITRFPLPRRRLLWLLAAPKPLPMAALQRPWRGPKAHITSLAAKLLCTQASSIDDVSRRVQWAGEEWAGEGAHPHLSGEAV